jgi:cytochrome o ubiquinol oxidase subunit 1
MVLAFAGATVILLGIVLMVVQLVVSIRRRDRTRDMTGDPWNGRTLEWSTSSPPPSWNFAALSTVSSPDAFWSRKQQRTAIALPLRSITVPRRNALGVQVAFLVTLMGFGLVWHIWWMAVLGLVSALAVSLRNAWRVDLEETIPVSVLTAHEDIHATRVTRI